MAEHSELVAEMSMLEQMGTQERQKLAKKRRLQQLKKWGQREKEWIAKEKQINKRLANTLQEENNGLNLKQYTTYSSSYRSKKKFHLNSVTTNSGSNNDNSTTAGLNGAPNNNNTDYLNNNNNPGQLAICNEQLNNTAARHLSEANLMPNGRVHFNVGVMLLEAAARNDYEEVKRLLMLGVSPDSINHDGLTALHQCCIDASEPIMKLLLDFGANVDARDTEQWTPIHAASTCGHLNLVKILVEYGANLLAVNGDGNMPFDVCEDEATLDYIESQMVKQGITQEMIDLTRASTEMQMISDAEQLVAQGKDLNLPNEVGITPLHVAAANGYLSVVKFLLKHGVNVNVCDNDLWQPLHGAACWGNEQHLKIIELLVEAGAQLDAKTINDETVFDLCDNVELLDRMNQLKDELESKQASGIDRLKRTQSRTNSRVHSVRRTSVRDKNQISRREAREEALLRVENSPEPKRNVEVGKDELSTNSNARSHEMDTTKMILDAIDGLESEKISDPTVFEPELDLVESSDISNDIASDCNGTKPIEHHDQQHNNSEFAKHTSPVKSLVSSSEKTTIHNGTLPNGSANLSVEVKSNSTITMRASKTSVLLTNSKEPARPMLAKLDHDTNTANDASPAQQTNTQSSALVQLAPINYTLSNLKKQRSDLRMRTTSIGGGSSVATSGEHNASSVPTNQVVVLDPQPASLPCSGLNRPGSPSLTFRKFCGEPGESIGAGERASRRHKCCILT